MASVFGCVLMAAISFPISFVIARGCLRGLLRVMNGGIGRDVL
jgi:hypothetical protein